MNPALSQFKKEIRQFYRVSIFNIIFAALFIAIGVQYNVAAILGQAGDPTPSGLRILSAAVSMVCLGLGISWILSSIKIFEGIETIEGDLKAEGDLITDTRITCLIIRMLAHYRDNQKTIGTMIAVCTAGGIAFFILGITSSLEVLKITTSGLSLSLNNLLLIPAMLLTLGIALASLLSSYYFSRFARTWDRRLHEIDESECTLKEKLGLDEP